MPPGERRDKPLFVLMTPALHKALTDIARKNGRSLSEEVTRRLSVSLPWPDWEDLDQQAIAEKKAVLTSYLIEAGRAHWRGDRESLDLINTVFDRRLNEVEQRLTELASTLPEEIGTGVDIGKQIKAVVIRLDKVERKLFPFAYSPSETPPEETVTVTAGFTDGRPVETVTGDARFEAMLVRLFDECGIPEIERSMKRRAILNGLKGRVPKEPPKLAKERPQDKGAA